MEVISANGVEIAYARVGDGPPIVFVHGAAEDGRVWRPQLAALADEFTLVGWDEPGAGRSSDLPAGCRLELAPSHVVGFSWGSTVVLELYLHHPELVATLILASGYAGRARQTRSIPDVEPADVGKGVDQGVHGREAQS